MFAKRLIQKATQQLHLPHHSPQHNLSSVTAADLDFQVAVHYGIPSTASIISFDPIQRLLAIGTLDGRIKVIGGDNIEGLLISQKQLPYKYLEFLVNQGYLVSISNDNDIQVWNLESRCIMCSLQWESNITAFSVINGSYFMYIGDENGLLSVLKYEPEDEDILLLPYHISADSLAESAGSSFPDNPTIVGVLPQPCSYGNRVLIAYDSGLIILWDVVEARVVMVRGDKVLDLKDGNVNSHSAVSTSHTDDIIQNMEEKEISASCWASSDGSILAVGYIDGDILFWKTSSSSSIKVDQGGYSSNNVLRLQLSSAEKRLPVVVLHWSSNNNSQNDADGHLYIYGGDEIGSDEVVTVLSLVWSPGMETLRCTGRSDLHLSGSFADMILSPSAGEVRSSHNAALFVLTSPGRLNYYDHNSLSGIANQDDKRVSISSAEYPMVVPTVDPVMTATKLITLSASENSSKNSFEMLTHLRKCSSLNPVDGIKWPMTGGISKQLVDAEDRVGRLYVAGYEDGSVRIWDATYPVLSLLCVLPGEVKGLEVTGSSSSVLKLDFCSLTCCLAVGNKYGLVRLYCFNGSLDESSFHFITELKSEAYSLTKGEGLNFRAIFGLLQSPIQALQFALEGAKLAVGFECGRVALIDMSSLSVSFLSDCLSEPSSPVVAIAWEALRQTGDRIGSPKISEAKILGNTAEQSLFALTKDAKIYVIDGGKGSRISPKPLHVDLAVISMYVIDGNITSSEKLTQMQEAVMDAAGEDEPSQDTSSGEIDQPKTDSRSQISSEDPVLLLCCKDALLLYHMKSVVKGKNRPIRKMKLATACCWTTTFKKFEKLCGIVLLYQTGDIEVRALSDLELVYKTSLMSILSWNFKANMDRTMSSTENGEISLASGREVAFISLLTGENNFRIPESLPCLHDKVVAAAAEAAFNFSLDQKKRKGTAPGILGGIVKGFKGGKVNNATDLVANSNSNLSHLEQIFKRNPFPEPVLFTKDDQIIVDEIDIDDIHIDEPVSVPSTSAPKVQKKKGSEREQLFDGEATNGKPRLRTREEILATYRKDASSVAGQARDKLLERQEKLERISRNTEELRNGAEDFASLANELVKEMERRKWWQI
ncbi:uncharacterized protein LOC141702301 [Apium graveolens]|uniref:V-SNARE coiled-coil homology domain-containing protein n=1 Tax=Apium graveolens TaxID=4045 RepID=A0A6L5B8S9_APIGR|nr:hypothetical protein AG4045_018348 [Apium graveolens]